MLLSREQYPTSVQGLVTPLEGYDNDDKKIDGREGTGFF